MNPFQTLCRCAALALVLAPGVQGAQAAGASSVIAGMSGLYLELSVQSRRDFCAMRFKDMRAAWDVNLARWQQRNTTVLSELRTTAARLEGAPQEAAAAATLQQFKLMAGLAPATNLAPLVDEQAARVCTQWLSDLEPAGTVEQVLPQLLDAARKLQAAPR